MKLLISVIISIIIVLFVHSIIQDDTQHQVAANYSGTDENYSSEERYQAWKQWMLCVRDITVSGHHATCGVEPYFDGELGARDRLFSEKPKFLDEVVTKEETQCRLKYKTQKAQQRCINETNTLYR